MRNKQTSEAWVLIVQNTSTCTYQVVVDEPEPKRFRSRDAVNRLALRAVGLLLRGLKQTLRTYGLPL